MSVSHLSHAFTSFSTLGSRLLLIVLRPHCTSCISPASRLSSFYILPLAVNNTLVLSSRHGKPSRSLYQSLLAHRHHARSHIWSADLSMLDYSAHFHFFNGNGPSSTKPFVRCSKSTRIQDRLRSARGRPFSVHLLSRVFDIHHGIARYRTRSHSSHMNEISTLHSRLLVPDSVAATFLHFCTNECKRPSQGPQDSLGDRDTLCCQRGRIHARSWSSFH